jgi:hypothetical protein
MGQGRLSPLWVWARPKVLPLLLSLCIQKRRGLGAASPPKVLPLTFVKFFNGVANSTNITKPSTTTPLILNFYVNTSLRQNFFFNQWKI